MDLWTHLHNTYYAYHTKIYDVNKMLRKYNHR